VWRGEGEERAWGRREKGEGGVEEEGGGERGGVKGRLIGIEGRGGGERREW